MRIFIMHNKYGNFSGEERIVESQIQVLRKNGHNVKSYFRSSEEIDTMSFGKPKAFFSSFFNSRSINSIKTIIREFKPEIIHIHNLYPFIPPVILKIIKQYDIPIVMTVHNYRLICPNGLLFNNDDNCTKCTGIGKELNCITNNCEGSFFKSTGYALRNFWSRTNRYYMDNIDIFLTLSGFQNEKLIEHGIDKDKCQILPNFYWGKIPINDEYRAGEYIGYVGRLSKEKGVDLIIDLARKLPHVNFKIAGRYNKSVEEFGDKPLNLEYVGFLNKLELDSFYRNCKFVLFPSKCHESFGLSIIEAFAHKKPVVSSDMGASSEIIENGVSGIIFKNNNIQDLKSKVLELLRSSNKIYSMGNKGYEKVIAEYSIERYFNQLINVYESVIERKA